MIKNEARRLGFENCGISKAQFLEVEAPRLESWLERGYQGKMTYMENHFDKRLDPRLLVPGAKSVISLSYNYFPSEVQRENTYKIAKYAYGEDYHHVVKDKLKALVHFIEENIGAVHGRAFVDSAPVMERSWAQQGGLGWIGKHSLLIQKGKGSFYFLAELILDLDLLADEPFATDHCGNCNRCVEVCPTDAIVQNQVVDASKCISYFTIELKDSIPASVKGQFDDWIFGCDLCQDVCPWNRFALPMNEPKFSPDKDLLNFSNSDWEELTEEVFKRIFKKSAVKRSKFVGLKRNIEFVKTS